MVGPSDIHKGTAACDISRKMAAERHRQAYKLPDLTNPDAVQRFFLQAVLRGEELLDVGDIEEGVEHLSYAVAVCGQPQQLLHELQQTVPEKVFALLEQKLRLVKARLVAAEAGGPKGTLGEGESSDAVVIEEVVD